MSPHDKLVAAGSEAGPLKPAQEFLISGADVTQAFSRETGLPMWLLDDERSVWT
jgi:hypothetical protein